MPNDEIRLLLDGDLFEGWTEATINRSVESIAGSFSLTMLDIWPDRPIGFAPSTECIIKIGDDTLITGYLDDQRIKLTKLSNLITVNGRCKTGDLVDCSADNKPGSWTKPIELLTLANALANPYGIEVIADGDLGEKVKEFSITTGESVFEIISKLCQDRGLLPISTVEGKLLLTTIGRIPTHDKLIFGENVVGAEGFNDFKDRYSKYILKGQQSSGGDGWGGKKKTIKVVAESFDENITRNRVKIFTGNKQLTFALAQKRVNWEAQVRAGRSTSVQVDLEQFRQSNGDIWRENTWTYLNIPDLRIDGEMLIRDVEYKMTKSTQALALNCVDPTIYEPNPKKKQKKKSKENKAVWIE